MSGRYPDWARERASWPHHAASRFVDAGGYRFHVQRMGDERLPVALLLHGTGAATHSWRDVMPLLAPHHHVIAPDLPGHGFTRPNFARAPGLPEMASAIAALMDALGARPALIVGHSAGAAIAAQLMLDRPIDAPLIGLAPALMPFPGLAARLFPQLARMLFTNPFVSVILSRLAGSPSDVARFLRRTTGSQISAETAALYHRLFRCSGHVDGAIRMMANWQLEPLKASLPRLAVPVLLVHPHGDSAIPESAVRAAADLMPAARMETAADLGHLAHEEAPGWAAELIMSFATAHNMA